MIRICVVHNEVPAVWRCSECGNSFCDECAKHSNIQGVSVDICNQCGGRLVPAESIVEKVNQQKKREFWKRLPGVVPYPIRSGGLYILMIGTIFFIVIEFITRFMLFTFLIGAIMAGFLCKYYVKVIRLSARGIERTPSWGEIEFTDLGDFVAAFLRTLAVAVFCAAVPVAYFIFVSKGTPDWMFFTFLGIAIFYYPMALLSTLYYEDILEMNPFAVFRSILSVPIRYFVVVIIFFIAIALGWGLMFAVALIEIPYIGSFIHRFVALYFYTMVMYLLGMFLYTNKEKLGWD